MDAFLTRVCCSYWCWNTRRVKESECLRVEKKWIPINWRTPTIFSTTAYITNIFFSHMSHMNWTFNRTHSFVWLLLQFSHTSLYNVWTYNQHTIAVTNKKTWIEKNGLLNARFKRKNEMLYFWPMILRISNNSLRFHFFMLTVSLHYGVVLYIHHFDIGGIW